VQLSDSKMRKQALGIGNNYVGTEAELSGCFNDVKQAKAFLKPLGYEFVTKKDASRAEILRSFDDLVSSDADKLYFHYSGHGSQSYDRKIVGGNVPDWLRSLVRGVSLSADKQRVVQRYEESDGLDECLCGTDADVIDDELFEILKKLRLGAQLISVLDCCHSGSAFDLKYNYSSVNDFTSTAAEELVGRVVMISGCRDAQTSADVGGPEPHGALTASLFRVLTGSKDLTLKTILGRVRKDLKTSGFDQVPQLSVGKFEDIKRSKLNL
jgi:metacaspase-1